MIYKSFIRKKTTKIYLFIIILILSIFELLIYGKNHYLKLYNENYVNAYITVPFNHDNYNKLQQIKNINKIERGVVIENNLIISNQELQENEILLPKNFNSEYQVNDIFKLELYNQEISLTIKNFTPSYNTYVNENFINKYLSSYEEQVYVVSLKNWFDYQKTVTKLEKQFQDKVIINLIKKNNIDYKNIMIAFNIFIILNIILFLVILLLTIFNILEDDKKTNLMYQALGFSKNKIITCSLIKLLSLFLISFFISTIIATIIYLIVL